MEIKLLTWNVNYWQNTHKEELRDYLNEYEVDFILLQEAKPDVYSSSNCSDEYLNTISYKNKTISYDYIFKKYEMHYHEIPYDQVSPYGSMIISKKYSSIKNHFMPEYYYSPGSPLFQSTLLCYDFKVGDNLVTLINIYRSPTDKISINQFHYMINDIESITKNNYDNHLIILAGDFNISAQPTSHYPNGYPGSDKIFERIHGLGFINCTMEKYGKHIQTIKAVDYQDDYIFINKPYKKDQDDVNFEISPLSDHYLLELKYKL
jgi:exonuclease III